VTQICTLVKCVNFKADLNDLTVCVGIVVGCGSGIGIS